MGYKLAGYEVLGCCEIDPKMWDVYVANHMPKHAYKMSIQSFRKSKIHEDLYNLDVLDGSPPCSSFSMVGSRDKDWGKNKKFREGQAEQVLDDLFFEFIALAETIKPKVVVAENVKGLIQGKARGYCKMIFDKFKEAGYEPQLFLLNSASMGVPQRRERTFFIATRKDLELPRIKLGFRERPISVSEAIKDCASDGQTLPPSLLEEWNRIKGGEERKYYTCSIANPRLPAPTLTSKVTTKEGSVMHYESPRKFSTSEVIAISTFPTDFNFRGQDAGYICGMAVPPFMMQRIAVAIRSQLLI